MTKKSRHVEMMEEYLREMSDTSEIERIRARIESEAKGAEVPVAGLQPGIKKAKAVQRLSSIAEGVAEEDKGRK